MQKFSQIDLLGSISESLDLRMQSLQSLNNTSPHLVSSPIIILKIVDLPAPLGPFHDSCLASEIQVVINLSPYAFATPLASITFVPKRGPFGI
jgi:hypothetical protein